jgi:flavodoxin
MRKKLVAYFSHSGNTREIAGQIQKTAGADIFEIQSMEEYPGNYDATVKQAKQELESNYKPMLKSKIENSDSYEVIFIGYPNWWSTIPMPVVTFLTEYDFKEKTIVPFCTHEGSRLGRSVADITRLCPDSTVLDGLAVRGGSVIGAQNEVSVWLKKIGITENN